MSTDTPPTSTTRATRKAPARAAAATNPAAAPATVADASAESPAESPAGLPAELTVLRAEVARLRGLVGPDEVAYTKLKTELWKARDAAMGAELAAGTLRGRVQALESQLVRVTRQTRWVKRLMISPVRRAKDFVRTI